MLTFKNDPNYEDPADDDADNMYQITVRATDSESRTGTKDVTVKVTNEDEDGTVTLTQVQPRVGVPIEASLEDPDGGVYGLTWAWTSSGEGDAALGSGETYTPKTGDLDNTLTATATYRDAVGAG